MRVDLSWNKDEDCMGLPYEMAFLHAVRGDGVCLALNQPQIGLLL
jgi:hypothetical protein